MYQGNDLGKAAGFLGGAAAASGLGQVMNAIEGQRKPELMAQIDRLDQAIGYAHDALTRLRDRLDGGSLRPAPPQPTGMSENKLATAPPTSGYASTLYEMTARAGTLGDRINDILSRLEV